jgi:steroid delta-isomerase
MSTEMIQQAVVDYFAATRAMNAQAWVATMAEDVESHDPVGSPVKKGHAAMLEFFAGIAGAFETVGLTPDQIFIAGNEAAVKWTGRGTGKNGRTVTFEGIDILEVNAAGKIQTIKGYWDPAAMMAELME